MALVDMSYNNFLRISLCGVHAYRIMLETSLVKFAVSGCFFHFKKRSMGESV